MRLHLTSSLTSGVLIGSALLLAGSASAETLREAMVRAYQSNPSITGQRAAQRATDENVPIAKSNGLPSLQSNAQIIDNIVVANNNFLNPERVGSGQVQLSVPLYQGGAVKNAVRAAETRVDAGRAQLRGVEANLFTNVVAAYMNVIRDEAIVNLNTRNVNVLDTNLRASRDRFQVGDLTRTDVAQSEARLAQARAQLQSAQANLISSRENYINVVGVAPVGLEQPPALPTLPASPNQAVAVALDQNPQLIAARRSADATRYDINVARANRLPRVAAVSSGNYFNYLGSLNAPPGRAMCRPPVSMRRSGCSCPCRCSRAVARRRRSARPRPCAGRRLRTPLAPSGRSSRRSAPPMPCGSRRRR